MKHASELGSLLLYDGELVRVVGITEGRTICLEYVERSPCARCNEPLRLHLLEHAPLFQDHVEAVYTLDGQDLIAGERQDAS